MTGGPVLVAVADEVATITLNRPGARNAISRDLLRALQDVMAELAGRDDIGAVVLTGADPAFCAGLDLKELSSGTELLDGGRPDLPPNCPWTPLGKPLLAAVNGPAVTGGLELVLNCDFAVASDRALFADTHARVGVMPGWGLSVLLPQRVGVAMARRMSFTGDFEDAHRLAATMAANHRPAVRTLHASYRRIEAEMLGTAPDIELETARQWRRSGSIAGIAERVPGLMARGRGQAGT